MRNLSHSKGSSHIAAEIDTPAVKSLEVNTTPHEEGIPNSNRD